MLVSITIAAKNEEENISRSLSSALNQSHSPIEIFLIDDTSTDRTVEAAESTWRSLTRAQARGQEACFRVIRNRKNLGFGGSHNVGIRSSSGELVLCLNADCELDKDYVKYAVEVFKKNPAIGGVQGRLANPRTGKIDSAGLLFFKNRRVINRGQGDEDSGQYNKPEEIWGVDGASPVYRRAALEDTKVLDEYFDEDFFAYKEDIDLSWRMRHAGWKMYYEPRARAYHERSAGEGTAKNLLELARARRNISDFSKYHSFANQRLMQIKNESPSLFIKHSYAILPKELLSWLYVLLFERHGARSIFKFLKLAKKMLKKRKIVMAKKRTGDALMAEWFI